MALEVLRHHRLLELYLHDKLNLPWDQVHDEAERLEHAISDELAERMAAALGNPGVDPHGDPIPTADGVIAEVVGMPLSEVPAGTEVEVLRVNEHEPGRLRYLAELGLVPGAAVAVLERQPFDGPITIRTEAGERSLGSRMARDILCAGVPE